MDMALQLKILSEKLSHFFLDYSTTDDAKCNYTGASEFFELYDN
jgi:hypothetical protein